ncbi:cas1 appressorium specific protein [Colletotrichum incanum]|uniref:Cas1 appressorium specific protein n=1 Tax=Colletotrichum incanum TaxID=1573173 RepID=A0A167D131_COLIC|nr:cas1 appressorium specific protein [Colletotrichum incanum]OHW99644.1 cas1 appressorium specific protein [Colletotrichum incanum]
MLSKTLLLALATAPFAVAHGKCAYVTGNLGGNATALGIQGDVVPGAGPNRVTEVDTTVFGKKALMTDGLGKTTGQGKNQLEDIQQVMALSGDTLPQVSSTGGSLTGVYHIVTTDGAGPLDAVVDTTGTGAFSQGTKLQVLQQVPGNKGNIRPNGQVPNRGRALWMRALSIIAKRASNVNMDFPMAFAVPDGLSCSGTMGGQNNVCLVKIANNNNAGPFGGVVPMQIVSAGGAAANPAAPAGAPPAKRSVEFQA